MLPSTIAILYQYRGFLNERARKIVDIISERWCYSKYLKLDKRCIKLRNQLNLGCYSKEVENRCIKLRYHLYLGCYSKEVELENRCSELRYQLYRQQEEYQDLRRTLASTEDMTGNSISLITFVVTVVILRKNV